LLIRALLSEEAERVVRLGDVDEPQAIGRGAVSQTRTERAERRHDLRRYADREEDTRQRSH
jgi:hypothetical protein